MFLITLPGVGGESEPPTKLDCHNMTRQKKFSRLVLKRHLIE